MNPTPTGMFVRITNPENDPNVYAGSGEVVRFCTEPGNENFVEVLWDDGVTSYHFIEDLESY